jgi:catechol 2,3-dioxygenase-like lactoylglutathione lyase family enzyme
MTIQRLDHVGVVVDDLAAAVAFFVELGLDVQDEGSESVEGQWVDRVVGLENVRVEVDFVRTPDGRGRLELTRFHTPKAVSAQCAFPSSSTERTTRARHRCLRLRYCANNS